MMKFGIMTLWQTEHNYGAVLQCFALQKHLKKMGGTPYLIRYKDSPVQIKKRKVTLHKLFSYAKKKASEIRLLPVKDQPRYFGKFIQTYMEVSPEIYIGYEELKKNPPEADVYIAGSDQIWNFYNSPLEYCKDNIHAYFLDFGKSTTKRVSYAASWDSRYVNAEHLREIKPLINQLDYISVREPKGIELCHKCGIENAEWAVDPTLLLSAEEYRNIYRDQTNEIRKIEQNYILIYMVMTHSKKYDLSYIYEYADKNNLRVIYVAEDKSLDRYEKYYPTIPEWLYLVDHAKYVITNSFHGTVFSILFHKQFGTIPLEGYSAGTNERIFSLCEMFQIQPRMIYEKDLSILDHSYNVKECFPKNHFDHYILELIDNTKGNIEGEAEFTAR